MNIKKDSPGRTTCSLSMSSGHPRGCIGEFCSAWQDITVMPEYKVLDSLPPNSPEFHFKRHLDEYYRLIHEGWKPAMDTAYICGRYYRLMKCKPAVEGYCLHTQLNITIEQ